MKNEPDSLTFPRILQIIKQSKLELFKQVGEDKVNICFYRNMLFLIFLSFTGVCSVTIFRSKKIKNSFFVINISGHWTHPQVSKETNIFTA